MANFLKWLKANWVTVLTAIIAIFSGGDIAVGLGEGKSLANISMFPAIAGAVGASGFLGLRWLNNKTVTTRPMPASLPVETMRHLESLFEVACHPSVTMNMVTELSNMAAAAVILYANEAKLARNAEKVKVMPAETTLILKQIIDAISVPVKESPDVRE